MNQGTISDEELAEIRLMLDERAITKILVSLMRGADRADVDMMRGAFHEDAVDNHGAFTGRAADYLDQAATNQLQRYSDTLHYLTKISIELQGDTAYTETYLLAVDFEANTTPPRLKWFGGRYVDRFERRLGVWKIAERTVVHDFDHDQDVNLVPGWMGVFPQGRRNTSDLSYAR